MAKQSPANYIFSFNIENRQFVDFHFVDKKIVFARHKIHFIVTLLAKKYVFKSGIITITTYYEKKG